MPREDPESDPVLIGRTRIKPCTCKSRLIRSVQETLGLQRDAIAHAV